MKYQIRHFIFPLQLIIAGIITFGCTKGEDICSLADFIFVNESGADIFNPSTQDHLDISDFKVYAEDSINRLNYIEKTDSGNVVEIWVYGAMNGAGGNTFLKFGNLTTDTIYAEFKEKGNSTFISRLYYNGKLIVNNSGVTECSGTVFRIKVKPDGTVHQ